MYTSKFYSIALLLLFCISACSPSAENEQKKWKHNTANVNDLMKAFPTFASLLEGDLKEAQTKWSEAEKISEAEQKAQKMSEANDIIFGDYISQLYSAKSRMEKVEEKKQKIHSKNLSSTKAEQAEDAIKSANEKVAKAKTILSQKVATKTEAQEVVKEANAELIAAVAALDRALKKKKKRKKKS
ncbi:hypothetical protein ACE193_18080 [Bernardetia sp. OM2101]|uniref:hypothetical protein n=1 Tax=Bernardetia sp. OM2101 TaxID=3344876 RepID=UPI0035D0901D